MASWLYSPSNSIFWTLDDPQSLALKKRYADAYGLAGMMLWEISGDDNGGSLIRALHSGEPGTYLAGTSETGPAVSITQPVDCAISLEGFNQVINATADGSAVQVEFFPGGMDSLGFANRSPWSWAWFNLPAGEHELFAVATDSGRNFGVSAPVRLTVYGENSGLALWQTGDSYAIGDEVFYEGCIYSAKRNHVGSRVRPPSNNRYWQLVTCEDCGGGGNGNPPNIRLKCITAWDRVPIKAVYLNGRQVYRWDTEKEGPRPNHQNARLNKIRPGAGPSGQTARRSVLNGCAAFQFSGSDRTVSAAPRPIRSNPS